MAPGVGRRVGTPSGDAGGGVAQSPHLHSRRNGKGAVAAGTRIKYRGGRSSRRGAADGDVEPTPDSVENTSVIAHPEHRQYFIFSRRLCKLLVLQTHPELHPKRGMQRLCLLRCTTAMGIHFFYRQVVFDHLACRFGRLPANVQTHTTLLPFSCFNVENDGHDEDRSRDVVGSNNANSPSVSCSATVT